MKLTKTLSFLLPLMAGSALASPIADSMFDYFDTDKNNELTMEEFKNSGVDTEGEHWNQQLSKVCTEKTLKMVEPDLVKTFKALDQNNDKIVTRKEFTENGEKEYSAYWKASFEEADKNKDKFLSKEEYLAQANKYVNKLKESYADKNIPVECKADMEYWQGYYENINQYAEYSFDYLDDNEDNKLSFEEYIGQHLR
ncbi:EF-hand domain-containing protein [Vibrio sp. HN007]|uniref:EF-hand domain-containing protein n=1 Tax=Vibrio iocasae TaxID=3098914 RepID=UPI0035D49BAD